MKIVATSNFDEETYSEEFINLPVFSQELGVKLVDAINDYCSGPMHPDHYKLVPDSYQLKRFEP